MVVGSGNRHVVPGCAGCAQILADQLTLFQPGGTDYAHLITTGTPGFSDLPTALLLGYEDALWPKKLETSHASEILTNERQILVLSYVI